MDIGGRAAHLRNIGILSGDRIMADGQSRKPLVYVIGGNDEYREELVQSLGGMYVVKAFKNTTEAQFACSAAIPVALIIDEVVPPRGGAGFIAAIRAGEATRHIPVVFTATKKNAEAMAEARSSGGVVVLAKPYWRSALLQAMSQGVNLGVEAEWEKIEPKQRLALKNTVASFNQIAKLIETGAPLPFGEIQDSCGPLVEAVASDNYKDILRGVQNHDNYSYVHSLRVATFLGLFGNVLGIKGDDLTTLTTGGLLHDIGKIAIPSEVLNKPGKLTDDEFSVMKSHVTFTIDHLDQSVDIPRGVVIIASQHHEKLDGSGYPNGLQGSELNQLARMASIIDIFGAITDRRVYKDPVAPERALDIMGNMTAQLDQPLLSVFREMLLDAATY